MRGRPRPQLSYGLGLPFTAPTDQPTDKVCPTDSAIDRTLLDVVENEIFPMELMHGLPSMRTQHWNAAWHGPPSLGGRNDRLRRAS